MKTPAAFGTWKSKIDIAKLTSHARRFGQIQTDGQDIYWTEWRPANSGRIVIVKKEFQSNQTIDVIPPPYSVGSRIYGYGGSSFCVHAGTVWFVESVEENIFTVKSGGTPTKLTDTHKFTFGDLIYDPLRKNLLAVAEQKSKNRMLPKSFLISIDTISGKVQILQSGADFYAYPRLSQDCQNLAWLEWNHPNMPWDGTCLKQGKLNPKGKIIAPQIIAGGDNESIFQPEYAPSPDNRLHFVSDRSGYWNLYRCSIETQNSPTPLAPMTAEFGLPQWNLGLRTYAFTADGRILVTFGVNNEWKLGIIKSQDLQFTQLTCPFHEFGWLTCDGENAIFIAGHSDFPAKLVRLSLPALDSNILAYALPPKYLPKEEISVAELITFKNDANAKVYGYFYPPKSHKFTGFDQEKPPLIVNCHGGPSSSSNRSYSFKRQFWTSRGFALLDVNYSGSTGFGRAYRQRLYENWGVRDVMDCIAGALHLVKAGKVHEKNLFISGCSAGGYTALCALTFHNFFRAGCSCYGISDLKSLIHDTHKFERRYLDKLIGPWPKMQIRYAERSPLKHAAKVQVPVLFLQGSDDKVVPANQANEMVYALKKNGTAVAYRLYQGEGHGFRRITTIANALHTEFYFYAQILGLGSTATEGEILIENFDGSKTLQNPITNCTI